MTRVIHTGDTHLGYRQYHSPERRRDFLTAFHHVVKDAIDEDVDAVIHSGDLFHDRSPALGDVHGAITALRDLRDAEIPFLAIVGNHERTRGGQWLDLFATLGLATHLGAEPERVGDVAVYGLDFVPRSKRGALTYDFGSHDTDFAALVAHGLFTPFNTEWNTREVLSASSVDFDVVLLGDDHQPDTARVDGTWVTYCGSTERTSAAERDERGYNIVEFDGERSATGDGVSIRRRGIETRPFVSVDVELSDGEGAERVRERLREEPLEDAVVVVSIEGDGEDLQAARIEEFASDRGALVARVTDRREMPTEGLDAVHFTDPDAAVQERIRELGLSEAALAIDETVRSDVADANVRDRVTELIEGLLEEPDAFVPGTSQEEAGIGRTDGLDPDDSAGSKGTGDDDSTDRLGPADASTDTVAAMTDASRDGAGVEATAGEAIETVADEPEEADTTEGGTESVEATEDVTTEPGTDESESGTDAPRTPSESEEDDGQVTMEDYL